MSTGEQMAARSERAAAMYRAGATWDEIEDALSTCSKMVAVLLRRAGVAMNRSGRAGLTRAEVAAIREGKRESALEMLRSGERSRSIERMLHVNGETVARWRREADLPNRRGDLPSMGLLTSEEILAPGSGDWDIDHMIAVSEARNAIIAASRCDGFVTPYFAMPDGEMAAAA